MSINIRKKSSVNNENNIDKKRFIKGEKTQNIALGILNQEKEQKNIQQNSDVEKTQNVASKILNQEKEQKNIQQNSDLIINDKLPIKVDKELSSVVTAKDGIFACGDSQINSAQLLLGQESSNLGTITAAMIGNFTQSTATYLNFFANNNFSDDDRRKEYKKAYYQDRCHTVLFFIAILIVYKKCSKGIFNTLKNAVNNSVCTLDDFIRLKEEVSQTNVTVTQPQA